jgi:hypothetical protein
MDLGHAIFRELGGAQGQRETVIDLTDALDWLVQQAGGNVSRAAREMGVPRRTLRRWLAGAEPREERAEAITEAAREAQRESFGDIGGLRVEATFWYAGGGTMKDAENRDIPLGDYLDDWVSDSLIDAYLDGAGPDELGEILASGINDVNGWYAANFDPTNPDGQWDVHTISGWRT